MKYGLLFVALSLTLHAEDAPKPKGTVNQSYLLYVDTYDSVCSIPLGSEWALVSKGTPEQCWENAIYAHNETVNDPHNHRVSDQILTILARQFRKQFKADAQ